MRQLEARAEAKANAEAEMLAKIEDVKAEMSSKRRDDMLERISNVIDPIYDTILKIKEAVKAKIESEMLAKIEDVKAETLAKIGTMIDTSIESDVKENYKASLALKIYAVVNEGSKVEDVKESISSITNIALIINERNKAVEDVKANIEAEMLGSILIINGHIPEDVKANIEAEMLTKIEDVKANIEAEMLTKIEDVKAEIGTIINEVRKTEEDVKANIEAEMLTKIEDVKAETKVKTSQMNVKSILLVNDLKGYVVIEAKDPRDAHHAVEGIRHIRTNLRGELEFGDIERYLIKKSTVSQLTVDNVVEITGGPFKGMKATITRVDVENEEAIVVLLDAAYQLPVTIDANYLKIISEA